MAIVRNRAKHILDLTGGNWIAPAEEKNIDTSPDHEQDLLAQGVLVLVGPETAPAQPATHWPPGYHPYDDSYAGHTWDLFVPPDNEDLSEMDDQLLGLTDRLEQLFIGPLRLDQVPVPTASVNMNGQKLVGLGSPTGAADAATKSYVDAVAQGLDVKAAVRAATTAPITLSGTQTVDGVALIAGDRVLVKNQGTQTQNGIYEVAAGAWTRTTDADTSAEVHTGIFTFVQEGTVNASTGWVMSTTGLISIGSTAIVFTQFSGTGQLTAGGGLVKSGTVLDVVAGPGIQVDADAVRIAPDAGRVAASDGIVTKTKAGAIVDGDFTATPVDGLTAVNTSSHQFEYRSGGQWRTLDRGHIDVEDWGADGTGVADSSSAFATILALANENSVIYSKPNRTYKIMSRLLINRVSTWDFNGSVIQADATLANDAVSVTAANVTMIGVVVDGNKASGRSSQQTIRWQADKGRAINCEARNGTAANWVLQSGTIELRGCRGIGAVGVNFETFTAGVARMWDCYSEGAGFVGFYYHNTASDGCFMDGCHSRLDSQSLVILNSHGTIGTFTAAYSLLGGVNVVATGPRKFLTTAFGNANSNMSFVCGLPGDHTAPTINVVFVNPGAANRALSAVWTGTVNNWTLTINLATNGASSINIADNSASRVIQAVYAAIPPSSISVTGGSSTVNDPHLVEVTLEPGNDGTGIVSTMASTALAGGSGHTPYGWSIGTMVHRRTGYNLDGTINTASGSGYTFAGGSDFQIGSLIAKDCQGYGVAFAAGGTPRIPACRMSVGQVVVDNLEALDGADPGVAIANGCFDITIGDTIANGVSWGIRIGDSDGVSYGSPPSGFRGDNDGSFRGGAVPARDLKFGRVQANRCVTGVMAVEHGRRIRVGDVTATDCGTNLSHIVGQAVGYGLLSFIATGMFTSGGSINASSTTFTLPGSVTTYYYYQRDARVKIPGAGPAGGDLVTRVTALSGSTLTLADAASTTVASATIQLIDIVCDDVTVESFEHLVTERLGRWQDLPINLVYCDPLATNITVRRYKALGCREAPARDDNGGNKFFAEWPERVRQLASADSTETWTVAGAGATVVDNTTAGQYSEGTGGKKITPAAGVTGSGASPAFGPFNLSGLPDETWFRLGVYVENFADAATSGIRFRLKSGASAYDEAAGAIGSRIYRDGLYYVHFRKRDINGISSGGSVTRLNWAAVNQVEVVLNNTAGNFRVTVDDVVQLGSTFTERQALPVIDTPTIRLGNGQSPLLEPLVTGGSGNPETVVAAPPASIYLDVTGGVWYRKTSGFAKTGWVLVSDTLALATKTTAYTITTADKLIRADATSAPFTVTLPTAVGIPGQSFVIKRINSGANNVTVATTSSQTIDGATTYVLVGQYQSLGVVSDGANWMVI